MRVSLKHLLVRTRRTVERIDFGDRVTFIHGPISKGKSSVVRLVDYCLGGELERTPALQQEFVSADLGLRLGHYDCTIERSASDTQAVRVSWTADSSGAASVEAPLSAGTPPRPRLVAGEDVFTLSDLLFFLCGSQPIRVRKRRRDPDSPLVRLSFRDIWRYCYLDQSELDSSFFQLEHPFKGRKSQDAMRFFTGLHSEALSQIETSLFKTIEDQRVKREAVAQIRTFIDRFELGSELGMAGEIRSAEDALRAAELAREGIESDRSATTHPSDALRAELRKLSAEADALVTAIEESNEFIGQQEALRGQLVTAKTRIIRSHRAGQILGEVEFHRCPECGTDISARHSENDHCRLCLSEQSEPTSRSAAEEEVFRRDLNERIDQLSDSIDRRKRSANRLSRQLASLLQVKSSKDAELQQELARYDSAYVERIRSADREIATLSERVRSLKRLEAMPQAINELETEAGALQGDVDRLRRAVDEERMRLRDADSNVALIAEEFLRTLRAIGFPGVESDDSVTLDPRTWRPSIVHADQEWTFWDTGSGGKKTLFNVCYALAVHVVAQEQGLPVPTTLIVDSPTKNISDDENPELIRALYKEIYRVASEREDADLQFVLIDSDIVRPDPAFEGFIEKRMAGTDDEPSLIPYYDGP